MISLRVVFFTALSFFFVACNNDEVLPIKQKILVESIQVSLTGSVRAVVAGESVAFTATASESEVSVFWKINGLDTDPSKGWISGDLDTTILLNSVGVNAVQVKATSDTAVGIDTFYVTVSPKTGSTNPVKFVGSRSSYYGFGSFPSPTQIASVYQKMAAKIPGSIPSAVWIVGGIDSSECRLEFPNPTGKTYPNIEFVESIDKHEPYLAEFDKIGAKVFLQVEAGMADMDTLIKLVMDKYSHHPCVAGFGVDIEWYPSTGETNGADGGINTKLTNEELRKWDAAVKKYNSSYRVYVKHWIPDYCGTGPVSDVIYINDTQGYSSASQLIREFGDWADYYAPNDVGFQIGYPNDSTWWSAMSDPLKEITEMINEEISTQTSHIFWVDFTLNHPVLSEYWK